MADNPYATYCSLCNQPAKVGQVEDSREIVFYTECQRCGSYLIEQSFKQRLLDGEYTTDRAKIIVAVRIASEGIKRGGDVPIVSPKTVPDLIASVSFRRNPLDAGEAILMWARDQMKSFSDHALITIPHDYPLFYLRNEAELRDAIDYILDTEKWSAGNVHDGKMFVRITPQGWHKLEELQRAGKSSRQAFVAMRFNDEMKQVYYSAFEPAIYEAGYDPYRVDTAKNNNPIDDEIIVGLKASGLVIADLTELRHPVFFEAGFGLGLGIPVIWTVREDWFDEAAKQFDTRQYPHIKWKDAADLKEQLNLRILATVPGSYRRDPINKS